MKNKDIALTLELAAVIYTHKMTIVDSVMFTIDARSFLAKRNKNLRGATIKAVNNEKDLVHLSLPYYSGLEESKAAVATDEVLEQVVGGVGSTWIVSYIMQATKAQIFGNPQYREILYSMSDED